MKSIKFIELFSLTHEKRPCGGYGEGLSWPGLVQTSTGNNIFGTQLTTATVMIKSSFTITVSTSEKRTKGFGAYLFLAFAISISQTTEEQRKQSLSR